MAAALATVGLRGKGLRGDIIIDEVLSSITQYMAGQHGKRACAKSTG
jgi:hypothetical protein